MVHKRQLTNYSCAAACFSIVTGIPEREAIEMCKTKCSGTHMFQVGSALHDLGKQPHFVTLNLPIEECWFFKYWKWPTIINGRFKTRYHKKGRPRERQHAWVLQKGMVYDPGVKREFPLEAYFHTFDSLFINDVIIVEKP